MKYKDIMKFEKSYSIDSRYYTIYITEGHKCIAKTTRSKEAWENADLMEKQDLLKGLIRESLKYIKNVHR